MPDYRLITVLSERFDYSGAYNVAQALGLAKTPLGCLLSMCKCSVNFDFYSAREYLPLLESLFTEEENRLLARNHEALIQGEPDAMFSEHLWNMRFQLEKEEYIDYLGRLYRFNEAVFKYLFVHQHLGKRSLFDDIYLEGRILRILRKKYKIGDRNIILAINKYFIRTPQPPELKKALEFLSCKEMKALADLRNDSIVGHGFHAVSEQLITRQFAPPEVLFEHLRRILEGVGLTIDTKKYYIINEVIAKTVERRSS